MEIEPVTVNGTPVAVVCGEGKLITDAQSALELAMSVKYAAGADRFAISKKQVCGEFFVLSTGIAGEILQKLCNYRVKIAIFGDFSHYTSKPLHDFIYESNNGDSCFFTATKEEALQKLSSAK